MTEPAHEGSVAARRSPGWLLLALAVTGIAVLGAHLINRYLEGGTVTGDGRRTLRILTWNIGKLYQARWDSRAADEDLDHVADVIRQVRPHVVALQELTGPEQLGHLVSLLGRHWRGRVPEDRYDRRAGLLLRIPGRFVKLPTSSGRVAQGAVIEPRKGTRLAVASVHLDAFDAERRLLQAEEIVAGVDRLETPGQIIVGDFNFDASLAAGGTADHRLYRFLTQQMADAGLHAGPTTVISRRLDYLFYRSSQVVRAQAQVLGNRRINIMDHDPLLVEMRLDAK